MGLETCSPFSPPLYLLYLYSLSFKTSHFHCGFSTSQDFLPGGEYIGGLLFGSHYCLFHLVAVFFFFFFGNTFLVAFNHNILSLSCGLLYAFLLPLPLVACLATKQTLQWRIKPTADSLNKAFFQEYEC